jgi:manganese transport protein
MGAETQSSDRWGIGRVTGYLERLGPTWLAGAIAAGPATMVSLLVAGASFGYALLWVVVLSAILGTVGQYLAMRLGLLTEAGIVAVVEDHLGSVWAWVLVVDVVLAAGLAQLVIMKTLANVSATIVSSAGIAAGVLGGAVHITLLTMQSYTMRARGWTERDRGIARFDVVSSMLVAFGIFSFAVFLVAASVLPEAGVDPATIDEIQAAQALGPIAGEYATWLFLLGLWGAAVSTLGGNTIVPPYLLADKLDWEQSVEDLRYRAALVAVTLASAIGAFLEGAFFELLVLVLAFGLVGTPFALAVILVLVNDTDVVGETNSTLENVGGFVLLTVAVVLASEFVLEELPAASTGDPIALFVVGFAVAMALAILGLVGTTVRDRLRAGPK